MLLRKAKSFSRVNAYHTKDASKKVRHVLIAFTVHQKKKKGFYTHTAQSSNHTASFLNRNLPISAAFSFR